MARVFYRLSQGWYALTAWARPVDYAAVEAVLTPPLVDLFRRMRRSEQLHSIRVMQTLRERGCTDRDLLTAALLHDVGKSRYGFGFMGRVLVVLVEKLAPARYAMLSQRPPDGLARPFAIAEQHPRWSAEDMRAAGASARACDLAARHASPPRAGDDLLRALQAADDIN